MAFTQEDGSGVSGANAYISLAEFEEHHVDRGRDVSGIVADDPAGVRSGIIRATDYMDQRWGRVLRGYRKLKDQGLEFPRLGAFDDDGYLLDGRPRQLIMACSEYSLRAYVLKELAPDAPRAARSQDFSDPEAVVTGAEQTSGVIKSNTSKVGPITKSVSYMSHAEIQALLNDRQAHSGGTVSGVWLPEYPTADLWMADLIEVGVRRLARG